MKHEKQHEEQVPGRDEMRRAFLTSALAGGAFGLIAGVVFLLTGATDASPLPVLGGITLVTATFSGLAGVVGTVLDNSLKQHISSPPLRTALIFLVVSVLIFGITLILIKTFGFEPVFPLERYAYLGMFLGLVFGAVLTRPATITGTGYATWPPAPGKTTVNFILIPTRAGVLPSRWCSTEA